MMLRSLKAGLYDKSKINVLKLYNDHISCIVSTKYIKHVLFMLFMVKVVR